jgi:hypothetical protein
MDWTDGLCVGVTIRARQAPGKIGIIVVRQNWHHHAQWRMHLR